VNTIDRGGRFGVSPSGIIKVPKCIQKTKKRQKTPEKIVNFRFQPNHDLDIGRQRNKHASYHIFEYYQAFGVGKCNAAQSSTLVNANSAQIIVYSIRSQV
jgi:hypothetical protein